MENPFEIGETVQGFANKEEVFGRYLLNKIIGRGGMGVVWKAYDQKLDEEVAIKFLPENVMQDQAAIRDLVRETKRSRELTHPNIVRTHDLLEDNEATAIVMEYVEGETLLEGRFKRSGEVYTVDEIIPLLEQVAGALDYAHAQAKIVHRDLKPANIMVAKSGVAKITDFGVARSLTDTKSRMTMIGASAGTMAYMSPQQLMGEKPHHSDDIYALGATIYELLVGSPPFSSGDITTQIMHKAAPAVNAERGDLNLEKVPDTVELAVSSCLQKKPEDRPQTAAEVIDLMNGKKVVPIASATSAATAASQPTVIDCSEASQTKSNSGKMVGILLVSLLFIAIGIGGFFLKGYFAEENSDETLAVEQQQAREREIEKQKLEEQRRLEDKRTAAEKEKNDAIRKEVDRLLTEAGVLVKAGKLAEADEVIEGLLTKDLIISEERRLARIIENLREKRSEMARKARSEIYVNVSPSNSRVYVDGDRSYLNNGKLMVKGTGKHIIEIKASNHDTVTKIIDIKKPGQRILLGNIYLKKDVNTLLAEQKAEMEAKLEKQRLAEERRLAAERQRIKDRQEREKQAKLDKEKAYKKEIMKVLQKYWDALDKNNNSLVNQFSDWSNYKYVKGRKASRAEVKKSFMGNIKRWPKRKYEFTANVSYREIGNSNDAFSATLHYRYNYADLKGKKASGFVIDDVIFKKNQWGDWEITDWTQKVDRRRNDKKDK